MPRKRKKYPRGTFRKLSRKLARKGVKDPDALAATIGRRVMGKKRFQARAAAGKHRAAKRRKVIK